MDNIVLMRGDPLWLPFLTNTKDLVLKNRITEAKATPLPTPKFRQFMPSPSDQGVVLYEDVSWQCRVQSQWYGEKKPEVDDLVMETVRLAWAHRAPLQASGSRIRIGDANGMNLQGLPIENCRVCVGMHFPRRSWRVGIVTVSSFRTCVCDLISLLLSMCGGHVMMIKDRAEDVQDLLMILSINSMADVLVSCEILCTRLTEHEGS